MPAWSLRRSAAAGSATFAVALAAAAIAAGGAPRPVPPIVFVSRVPPAGAAAGQVPGLGPHGTFVSTGGRLLERSPDGTLRELLAPEKMFDVADPAPSPDGRRIAFSGRVRADDPWRIWSVERATGALACMTCDDARPGDDADPAWIGSLLLFVSTRAGGRALYDGSPVTQLWARLTSGELVPLTHEQNGVLDPAPDAARDRIVFSRWWFNPWSPDIARGVARAATRSTDSVNVWQVLSARLARDGRGRPFLDRTRLVAGGDLPRRRSMGLQPAPLAGGGLVAVAARNTGLAPRPGTLALQRFRAAPSAGVRIAGAAIGDDSDDPYTENANLLAPAACAPAALPDGRLVYSLDAGGRGDFGLVLSDAGGRSQTKLVDLPGTWELDAAAIPARPSHPSPAGAASKTARAGATPEETTFRYLATDVFAGRGAATRRSGARLHVYEVVSADSIERVRTVGVPRNGRVDLMLPADTPLFELLTDSTGRVLMSAHGATQVRGFNSGAPGTTARCSGCHLGHSARR
jgi:hypothetical protein